MKLYQGAILSIIGLGCVSTPTRAQQLTTCPLNAQQYPSPTHLRNEARFLSAVDGLGDKLRANASEFPYNETSFSISVFTTSDEGLAWEYHHASPLLTNSSQGARNVDADSIYRIASMSKLTTVYLFLLCAGEDKWSDSIADWIPELLTAASLEENAAVPDWQNITIGDLAGQIADGLLDFSLQDNVLAPPPIRSILPPAPESGVPTCGFVTANLTFVACSANEYIQGAASEPPVFGVAYTPVYSNAAYVLVGVALERITGKAFGDLFDEHLVRPLHLNATSYSAPPPVDKHALVPGSPRSSFWDADLGAFAPAGGSFSSTRDFAALGKSILSSSLLPKEVSRRWLKPISFANGLTQGVGRPWEIIRLEVADGSVVDIYTKAGDLGAYDTVIALIPTYDVGFTLFTAADPSGLAGPAVRNALPNLLGDTLVNTANAVAKRQAEDNFAGTYTNTATNSSITVAPANELPGLRLTGWINNGSDIYNDLFKSLAADLDIRLLPNHLYDEHAGKVGFTSNYGAPMPARPFFGPCYSWINVDQYLFAGVPMGQMVFDVDPEGSAVGVQNLGLRMRLTRETG